MSIRIIAMDVDGTLYNSQKQITPRTKEALLRAQEKGVRLILASGRPAPGLRGIVKELEMDRHHGLMVCFNGSRVVDCESGEILFNQAMTVEEGKAILEHMKHFDQLYPMIDHGEYMYVNDAYSMIHYQNDYHVVQKEAHGNNYKVCEMDDLAAFVDFPLNKILTAATPEYLQAHYEEMYEPFKDRVNGMFTSPFYFEFTAKGIDKAKALDTVLRPMGYVPEELMAFGDGQNDKSMLQYAGVGVAMGNAVQELKDAADEITVTCNEDGIAATLEKYGI
jgi:Cof subfamily protein (haloacid dehalogenase superfamily)